MPGTEQALHGYGILNKLYSWRCSVDGWTYKSRDQEKDLGWAEEWIRLPRENRKEWSKDQETVHLWGTCWGRDWEGVAGKKRGKPWERSGTKDKREKIFKKAKKNVSGFVKLISNIEPGFGNFDISNSEVLKPIFSEFKMVESLANIF